jgi:hypothetical protein
VTLVAAIMEGLSLVERKTDPVGGVVWTGKDLLEEWTRKQCWKYYWEPEAVKACSVVVKPLELTAEQLEEATEAAKEHIQSLQAVPEISTEGLSAEQQRSVVNQKIVCKCGTSKKTEFVVGQNGDKHQRKSVWTGFKKRSRCKECPGCTATRCNECQFCLKPHLKKPCVRKVCQFPRVPKCPCFV